MDSLGHPMLSIALYLNEAKFLSLAEYSTGIDATAELTEQPLLE